jgi:hypothetical protein
MFAPWATITPSAPDLGTSISAVTEWDLFLRFRTQFSLRRPMPPKRSWVLPRISVGRQELALQFMELFRHLLGEVVRLAPVLIGVELPDIIIEGHHLGADQQPRCPVLRHRGPALVVDAAIAEDLEVLRLMPLGGLGIVKGVAHADALDGVLLDAIHRLGLREAGRIEDCRRHVDDVVELRPNLASGFDPLGPVDDGAVARSAPVGGDLFGPLVGSVQGVRPAHSVVVVRLWPAELVDPGHEELRCLEGGQPVEVGHLVVCAIQRALG